MSFYKEVPGFKTTLESVLKFDKAPVAGSTNPVTSEGVKSAIDGAVGDASEVLQEQIDDIAEKAGSGYTPKGEATVATLNALSGQENGELYTMTDAGTLTLGSLSVVAGDTVSWDATNSVWYKAMDYAPRQYGTNEVHNLPTTITAFRTGDVIPVAGPSGTAKMSKDDLLKENAEYNHTDEIINAISTEATYDDVIPYRNINNDGSIQELDESNPDNQWQVVTDYIPCTKDSVISEIQYCDISTNTKWGIAFYDSDKNFIAGYKAVNTGGTNVIYNFYKSNAIPTIPNNAAYLVLASNNSDVVDVQPYVTFKVLDNVIDISKDYTDKSIDDLEYVRKVPVVIVPNLPDTRIRNTGATASQEGTWSSDFIDLDIGEVDSICWGDIEAASTTVGIAFYDKDKTYISGYKAASVTPHSQPSTGVWQSTKMPSVPSGAKYFRFSGKPDVKVYPFVRFLAKGVDKFPALKDKKILVFGDSISDTLVSLGGPERYPEYLKKMTDCVIVPYAVSASGFGQDGSNSTYGNVDNKVWQQIELAHTNDETCDLIIVAAGTNDWDFGTPLGQFSDIELDDMVTPSFYFLVEKAIKKLASYFPTQRCLFITPLPRNQERSGVWVDQHTTFDWQPNPLTDYAKAIKEVCAWHSIPVLDMMNDSNMRLESAEARLLWTEDGLHPTNYYAATIYAPMVIRELTRCLVPYYAQT